MIGYVVLSVIRDAACKVGRFILFTEAEECVRSNGADLLTAPAESKEGETDRACEADQSPR